MLLLLIYLIHILLCTQEYFFILWWPALWWEEMGQGNPRPSAGFHHTHAGFHGLQQMLELITHKMTSLSRKANNKMENTPCKSNFSTFSHVYKVFIVIIIIKGIIIHA